MHMQYADGNDDDQRSLGFYLKDRTLSEDVAFDKRIKEIMTVDEDDILDQICKPVDGIHRDVAWQYSGGNGIACIHGEDSALHFSNDMIDIEFDFSMVSEITARLIRYSAASVRMSFACLIRTTPCIP